MKKVLALVLAATMSMMLVACGSDASTTNNGEAANTTTNEGADAAAENDADAAAENDADATAENDADAALTTVTDGVLTMSYEMTTDDGGFEGIDVEIAGKIAEKLGLTLQIDDMDFDSALLAVQQGKSDMVMAGVSVTDERLAVMNFSNTYATGIQVIIVKEGSDVTIDNLGDKMIGTQRATTGNIYCTDDYGEDHVVAYDNCLTATQALINDQVDCVVIDSAPAQEMVAANAGLTILDTEYVTEDYAIGLNKNNTALLDAVNKALEELTADGTIDAILAKYISAN